MISLWSLSSLSLKVWPLNSLLYPIIFLHQHTIISCLWMCVCVCWSSLNYEDQKAFGAVFFSPYATTSLRSPPPPIRGRAAIFSAVWSSQTAVRPNQQMGFFYIRRKDEAKGNTLLFHHGANCTCIFGLLKLHSVIIKPRFKIQIFFLFYFLLLVCMIISNRSLEMMKVWIRIMISGKSGKK